MPQTCLWHASNKVAVAIGDTFQHNYVNVCCRHAADIAGCPIPCCQQIGKVELSSTLLVWCFGPLWDDQLWFFRREYPSGANADILQQQMTHDCSIAPGGGGLLDLRLGREVLPGPWNPDLVYDKKFLKILKNRYPVYDFQVKFHSFFCQNAWFLDPVY